MLFRFFFCDLENRVEGKGERKYEGNSKSKGTSLLYDCGNCLGNRSVYGGYLHTVIFGCLAG